MSSRRAPRSRRLLLTPTSLRDALAQLEAVLLEVDPGSNGIAATIRDGSILTACRLGSAIEELISAAKAALELP